MEILKAFIIGLVQGLTEFLPVSSSGHLVLSKELLGFGESGDLSFEIFLHLGSLIAVIFFFRNQIFLLTKSLIFFNRPQYLNERKICLWLMIATIVTGVVGFVAGDFIERVMTRPLIVAFMLSVTGFIVYFSDKVKTGELDMRDLGVKKSLIVGLGQAIAIIPGISRSGSTITYGLLMGLKRSEAASFSFLLSIPVILGANIKELDSFMGLNTSQFAFYLVGFIAALISSLLVIKWLLKLIVKAKLCYFAYYCWVISLVSIVIIVIGAT